ncbi:unnamed protein product [Ceratitis capitata]|uniref:(Mediterranean fruit fly) hypothetical protein n=1 Tax=Ceratitis capitata TaxID=7213 RepID=A0A811U4J8_CERCA|nr:unnamed protein product [Ceratitis capitata]
MFSAWGSRLADYLRRLYNSVMPVRSPDADDRQFAAASTILLRTTLTTCTPKALYTYVPATSAMLNYNSPFVDFNSHMKHLCTYIHTRVPNCRSIRYVSNIMLFHCYCHRFGVQCNFIVFFVAS